MRRRRVLFLLLTATFSCVGAGLLGSSPAFAAAAGLAAVVLLFAVHCRRQAVLREERLRRRAAVHRVRHRAPRPAALVTSVARLPGTTPLPAPRMKPLPAAETTPLPAAGTSGSGWLPVPVPLPTYLAEGPSLRAGLRAPARSREPVHRYKAQRSAVTRSGSRDGC